MAKKIIDGMCIDCPHRGNLCAGSYSGFYSGCIWKGAAPERLEAFNAAADKATRPAGDTGPKSDTRG